MSSTAQSIVSNATCHRISASGITRLAVPFLLIFAFQISISVSFVVAQDSASATQKPDSQPSKSTALESKKKAAKKLNHDRFMRIRKDHRGRSMALETSIVRYERSDDDGNRVTVDLIGAVHIGERKYFQQLNQEFEKYESLLYELIAPEGTVIPKGGRDEDAVEGIPNPVAALQMGMKSVLELEFQLERIDYTKDNFVHADMSPEEFVASMESNDESIAGYALRAIGQSMAMQSAGKSDGSAAMLFAMFSRNKSMRMRRAMANQLKDMSSATIIFEGKEGSTIIEQRNAKCMKVLEQQIAAGQQNLAIFYGAGHLPDMEQRLINDFGMSKGGQRWLTAWKLREKQP